MTHSPDIEGLVDADALLAEMVAIAGDRPDRPEARARVLSRLKETLTATRSALESRLLADHAGLLCARRLSHATDAIVRAIYGFVTGCICPVTNPSTAEHLAVVAVGGYGRGTLAPGSDIDLLFLLPYKQTPWGESVVEYVLYMLWDLGLKVGHATRTVDETMRQAKADLTVRTALLEARFILGDLALYDQMTDRFAAEIVRGTSEDYIRQKLTERDERLKRQGGSRYLVEPNIKEGKGGLRDLQTLVWIARYHYRIREARELVTLGVLSASEFRKMQQAEDFLWATRCHMHFVTRRPEERLTFELQREIAARLGYQERAGQRSVERFMKHYFLAARDVGELTLVICAALEDRQAMPQPRLNRLISRLRPRRRTAAKLGNGFMAENNRITLASPDVFERDPVNLIRLFQLADRENLALHPDALKRVTRSLRLVTDDLRRDPDANRLFLDILSSQANAEILLRRMNEVGLLGRFIPEFGRVVGMMQFSMYHQFTVDEHLIRAVGELAVVEGGRLKSELPLASELMPGIQNRRLLYVATFLHDIGKGRVEDHSVLGARIARDLCPRFGLTEAETDTVVWLIERHLLMSTIATGRDLNDRKTIRDFAAIVQSPERLKLLLILTVCDIRAVGQGVFNGWKGQLLRTLYYETEPFLAGGHSQISRDERVTSAKAELRDNLADWPEAEWVAYAGLHYAPYWLRVDLQHKIDHARFIRAADLTRRGLATMVETRAFQAVTEITVFALDHPRLLSNIAGACAAGGGNIVGAQIYTTTDGHALDTIAISRQFEEDRDERRRAERICALIAKALSGQVRLPETLAKRIRDAEGKRRAFHVPTDVIVNNSWSERFTVIEVSGLDRPGLLYGLTRALSDLSLNIASAHVMTFGEKVVDVFYVTDLTNQKVDSPARQDQIRQAMIAAFGGRAAG